MIHKDFCCLNLGLHIKEVRYVEELSCSGNQTVEDFFAHMPEIADSDTGKKVQVSPAVKVPISSILRPWLQLWDIYYTCLQCISLPFE